MPKKAPCVKAPLITLLCNGFFFLKDPKVNDQPLKGKEVETNKRELPIHGTVEFNRKAKLLEDPSVCQCRKVKKGGGGKMW